MMDTDRFNLATETFLASLPEFEAIMGYRFRALRPEVRQERCQEGIALLWHWWAALVGKGKRPWTFRTTVGTYAARAVASGRSVVGCGRNVRLTSARAARFNLAGPEVSCETSGLDTLPVPTSADPAELVRDRLDYRTWLASLTEIQRRAALILATGETTGQTAKMLGTTAGAVSQMRQTLLRKWQAM